jgi:hypothetical protein
MPVPKLGFNCYVSPKPCQGNRFAVASRTLTRFQRRARAIKSPLFGQVRGGASRHEVGERSEILDVFKQDNIIQTGFGRGGAVTKTVHDKRDLNNRCTLKS